MKNYGLCNMYIGDLKQKTVHVKIIELVKPDEITSYYIGDHYR